MDRATTNARPRGSGDGVGCAGGAARATTGARRCRLPQFVKLAQRVVRHRDEIIAAIQHRLSNALVESMNTKIRLIVRMAFGFHSAEAIIALAMLNLGGHRPTLPNR
jgi:transposase